jgi:NTP pyrophosphatase (non-canonical NTP hydrolase)
MRDQLAGMLADLLYRDFYAEAPPAVREMFIAPKDPLAPGLDVDEYAAWTIQTAMNPRAGSRDMQNLTYLGLGLASEAGEVAGKLKKIVRGDHGGFVPPDSPAMEGLKAELGDVLWYLCRLIKDLGMTPSEVAKANREKLESRKARGSIVGSGDNR